MDIYPYVLDWNPRSMYFSHPLLDRPFILFGTKWHKLESVKPLHRHESAAPEMRLPKTYIQKPCGPKVSKPAPSPAYDRPLIVSGEDGSVADSSVHTGSRGVDGDSDSPPAFVASSASLFDAAPKPWKKQILQKPITLPARTAVSSRHCRELWITLR